MHMWVVANLGCCTCGVGKGTETSNILGSCFMAQVVVLQIGYIEILFRYSNTFSCSKYFIGNKQWLLNCCVQLSLQRPPKVPETLQLAVL